ncbi:hypothetical protein Tco_0672730 [Tanacetum coccineum]
MMASLSEDINSASFGTRPPMLDRSDFESWQQRIRLYCKGKHNGENILQSIDEGPFKMVKFREILADDAQGPKRDRIFKDLTPEEKERHKADIITTNILLQEGSELTKDERESQLYNDFEHFRQNKGETIHEYYVRFTKLINDMRNIMQLNSKFVNNMLPEWGRFMTAYPTLSSAILQSGYVPPVTYQPQVADSTQPDLGLTPTDDLIGNLTKTDALLAQSYKTHFPQTNNQLRTSSNTRNQAIVQNGKVVVQNVQAQENGVVLDEEQLLFIAGGQDNTFDNDVDEPPVQDLALNVDQVFQADQCDAFDSNVDEAPTAQTMFMVNLSSADPIYDEAGPSYDSDIISEVQDHDNYLDNVGEYHEVHEMQNVVQQNYIVGSDAEYTSDSNIIPYEQYVKNNAEQVVQSNVSSVPNDALMMIINDMHEQAAQCTSTNGQNKVVNESLTAELERYKEQVEIYEKGQESLKKELHSVKMQLNSTIDHNKLMKEEVATLKKDFKQKENKYLEDFLDMKELKEKVEDKLFKQDQSLQTVHMLCKSKPFYDEKKKVAIGYKNPLYLTSAMQVQSALYNAHEIVKTNHAPAVVHDSKDTLKLAQITRKRMLEKMKRPLWVKNKIKIAPPDYSKEN